MKTSKDCLKTLFIVGKSNILVLFDKHKASRNTILHIQFLVRIYSISIKIKYFICFRYTNYILFQVKFFPLIQLCFSVHSISLLVYSFGECFVIVFFIKRDGSVFPLPNIQLCESTYSRNTQGNHWSQV